MANPQHWNSRKTHCKRGHPLSGDNVTCYRGTRRCRTCLRDANAARYVNGPSRDPAWRSARGRYAQRCAREVYRQRALERVANLTPAAAYTKGYISGYNLAYRYWKRWAEQAIRRNQAA